MAEGSGKAKKPIEWHKSVIGCVEYVMARSHMAGCLAGCGQCLQLGKCMDSCLPAPRNYSIIDKDVAESVNGKVKSRAFLRATYSRRVDEMLRKFEFRGNRRPITDFYEKGELLGEGNFGSVKKWKSKQIGLGNSTRREEVAVKHIKWVTIWHGYSRDPSHEEELRHELKVLMMLDSPYIVRVREWFEHPRLGIYFVMELCSGGSLQDLLEEICTVSDPLVRASEYEPRLRRSFLQITYALAYLHGMQPPMVHRDLKPDNVLFKMPEKDASCKLVDFGLTSLRGNMEPETWQKGTQVFMAPQQFLQHEGEAVPPMDIWSLGVILTWMVTAVQSGKLQHPMLDDEVGQGYDVTFPDLFYAYKSFKRGEREMRRELFGTATEALDLAEKIVVFDEFERWTAAQIMGHEWMSMDDAISSDTALRDSIGFNLRSYSELGVTERTIIGVVAARLDAHDLDGAPLAALRQLRRYFRHLDTAKQGWLAEDEIARGFKDIPGGFTKQQIDRLFAVMMRDVSRKLYWTDWLSATIGSGILNSEDVMAAAFWSLDTQHKALKGAEPTIDVGDLTSIIGLEQATLMLDELGVEQVTFNKFRELMGGVAGKRHEVKGSAQIQQTGSLRFTG